MISSSGHKRHRRAVLKMSCKPIGDILHGVSWLAPRSTWQGCQRRTPNLFASQRVQTLKQARSLSRGDVATFFAPGLEAGTQWKTSRQSTAEHSGVLLRDTACLLACFEMSSDWPESGQCSEPGPPSHHTEKLTVWSTLSQMCAGHAKNFSCCSSARLLGQSLFANSSFCVIRG